ncbi:MAG TPA: Sir2 family NAD-dependent protein deacetylase [Candidatus Paceibacterota bacterium]|jgi:NAD-dependent deacetylase|nr:Sir2 family NAD-dependent protein deacetylase [Candidatus Paceibacterota bacterium]
MEGDRIFYPEKKEEKKNLLLEGPELISPEGERKQKDEMSFSFSSDARRYSLGHKNGKPFFVVEYFGSLPDELSETEKAKFTKEIRKQGDAEQVVYVLKHGEVPEQIEKMKESNLSQDKKYRVAPSRDFKKDIMNKFFANETNKQVMNEILARHSKLNSKEIAKIVDQAFDAFRKNDSEVIRILSNHFPKEIAEKVASEIYAKNLPKPQEIEVDKLAEILKNKKVLFYTGAGISMASGVPNMDQLQESLGIAMSEKTDDFLKKSIIDPQQIIDLWKEFMKASFEKPATPAHQALSSLSQKLKSKIFTENVDHLQEKTGVKAIHLTGPWLKENIQPEWLKDIDIVLTVGLSSDDRGFLSWYKENNPKGKIIAINLNQPPYLGNEDLILKGDCQKLVPDLEKTFSAKI